MLKILSLIVALIYISLGKSLQDANFPPFGTAAELRQQVSVLTSKGDYVSVIQLLEDVNKTFGTLHLDDVTPSFYSFMGVALYNVQRVIDAQKALEKATELFPNETRAWVNLGEIQVQTFQLSGAMDSFRQSFQHGDASSLPRLLRTMGWAAHWENWELYTSDLEVILGDCIKVPQRCAFDSNSGFEYTDIGGEGFAWMQKYSPASQNHVLNPLLPPLRYSLETINDYHVRKRSPGPVRVGFVSADFGVHPVSSLIRGFLVYLMQTGVEVHCFSLQSPVSWWGANLTNTLQHFHTITAMNLRESAMFIASKQLDIVVDLNGHTMHSGLPILQHRTAPFQLSYLGLPTTSGCAYIDYYLGDYIAIPPEHRKHYTESLALLPATYICNDHAQIFGDVGKEVTVEVVNNNNTVVVKSTIKRASREVLPIDSEYYSSYLAESLSLPRKRGQDQYSKAVKGMRTLHVSQRDYILDAKILLGTLSNSQKVDPPMYHVWMNALRRNPHAALLTWQYAGREYYLSRYWDQARGQGILPYRVVNVKQSPWIDHVQVKSSIDMFLDTSAKNGHTTGLDSYWAGVPAIGLAFQATAPQRAAQSIYSENRMGLSVSLKDYEDLLGRLLSSKHVANMRSRKYRHKGNLLEKWRAMVFKNRLSSRTFDTPLLATNTKYIFEAMIDARMVKLTLTGLPVPGFHVFSSISRGVNKQKLTIADQLRTVDSEYFKPLFTSTEAAVPQDPQLDKPALSTTDKKGEGHGSHSSSSHKYHLYEDHDNFPPLPPFIFDGRLLLLNIGGIHPAKEWLTVNFPGGFIQPSLAPDIHRPMHRLYGLPNSSVSAIYASHTLEHATVGDRMLQETLAEWFRVLRPGGLVMISVPDLQTLASLYLDPSLTLQERWKVQQMMYGAQTDNHDYHFVGFDFETLGSLLLQAGFCNISRVGDFRLGFRHRLTGQSITDSSIIVFKDRFISLNVVAKICPQSKPHSNYDGFSIDAANALPYRTHA